MSATTISRVGEGWTLTEDGIRVPRWAANLIMGALLTAVIGSLAPALFNLFLRVNDLQTQIEALKDVKVELTKLRDLMNTISAGIERQQERDKNQERRLDDLQRQLEGVKTKSDAAPVGPLSGNLWGPG